jgi:hypothetical protein
VNRFDEMREIAAQIADAKPEQARRLRAMAASMERHARLQVAFDDRRDIARQAVARVMERRHADRIPVLGHFVYILWGDDDKQPLYVGESGALLARLGWHYANRGRGRFIRSVQLLECATVEDRKATELLLIEHYQPPWNTLWAATGIATDPVTGARPDRSGSYGKRPPRGKVAPAVGFEPTTKRLTAAAPEAVSEHDQRLPVVAGSHRDSHGRRK